MRTELVTTLKRKATQVIAQPGSDQEPVLITQHGLPAFNLIGAEMSEGIVRGEKAILENRVLSHKEAKQRMARWLA